MESIATYSYNSLAELLIIKSKRTGKVIFSGAVPDSVLSHKIANAIEEAELSGVRIGIGQAKYAINELRNYHDYVG